MLADITFSIDAAAATIIAGGIATGLAGGAKLLTSYMDRRDKAEAARALESARREDSLQTIVVAREKREVDNRAVDLSIQGATVKVLEGVVHNTDDIESRLKDLGGAVAEAQKQNTREHQEMKGVLDGIRDRKSHVSPNANST